MNIGIVVLNSAHSRVILKGQVNVILLDTLIRCSLLPTLERCKCYATMLSLFLPIIKHLRQYRVKPR